MARAPEAIQKLYADVHKVISRARLGGIVGDVHHSFGYHLSRYELPSSDYSVCQCKADREGPSDAASALDITLPADLMKLLTKRLRAAIDAHDPRVKAVREFCGTLNGSQTYPYQQFPTRGSEGIDTWDDSHLWHIHISILRKYADNYAVLKGIAGVLAGKPMSPAQKAGAATKRGIAKVTYRKWVLPAGHFYGPISGPVQSHGGAYSNERPAIILIQKRLQALGAVPAGVDWKPEGFYGPATVAVVKAWQKATKRPVTGCITEPDWKALKIK